jgi:hypothetical protein
LEPVGLAHGELQQCSVPVCAFKLDRYGFFAGSIEQLNSLCGSVIAQYGGVNSMEVVIDSSVHQDHD